jgi:hypothetical protein
MLAYIAFWVEIPMRRAHQVVESGLPSVGWGLPPLPYLKHMSNPRFGTQGRATSQSCGLPPQGCTTSPRGAHFTKSTCSTLQSTSSINPQSNRICSLWPSPWLLGFYFAFNMSPHVPLFLPLLIFIDFIWLFWVLWAKMTFKWLKSLFLLN